MKKLVLILVLLLGFFKGNAQLISVQPHNNSSNTVQHLIQDVLIDSPCAQISNLQFQPNTPAALAGAGQIGYFSNTNPNLPMNSGVIMMTGPVTAAAQSANITSGGGIASAAEIGTPQLLSYMQSLGTNVADYNDNTVIMFDFLPLTNNFSFNFLFASDEYGTYQCSFSDAFAFFLTDLNTGTFTNLAVVPDTTPAVPIAVTTIRNNAYNAGCSSANPDYFDKYYGNPNGLDAATSAMVFNGHTVKMTASATVVPGNLYRIKLVIADRNDNAFNSAVFIEAGSFNVGTAAIGAPIPGSTTISTDDMTLVNGTALCSEECRTLSTGLPEGIYTIVWKKDGVVMPGETGTSLVACEAGVYCVEASVGTSSCMQTDCITIEANAPMEADEIDDIHVFGTGGTPSCPFDLEIASNQINSSTINIDNNIDYYATLEDLEAGINMLDMLGDYIYNSGYNGQTIYARINSDENTCYLVR